MQNDAQEISYILWDNLFTPKKLVDSSGTVVWDAALKPYGGEESILGAAVMNLRMPGQYVDEETGRGSGSSLTHPLYYNYNRDYDPATGRYTQVDPIGLAGGVNTYAYANGSPKRYIDPNGLSSGVAAPLLCFIPGVGWVTCGGAVIVGGITSICMYLLYENPPLLPDIFPSVEGGEKEGDEKEEGKAKKKGGGKNAKHANQKKRDEAAKKYKEAKERYESLKSQPNKTPAVKKEMGKAKKAMEKAKKDMDFTGEHHSGKAKGNR